MKTIEIRRGTRFYPPGLNDLGDKAPEVLYVRGNHEALAQQAVVIAGSSGPTPRGSATTRRISEQISRTDIAIVTSDNALGRLAVGAATQNGAAIVYFQESLDQVIDDDRMAVLLHQGATFVSLCSDNDPRTPVEYSDLSEVLAAHSTIVLVPEADNLEHSLWVADDAAQLGRKIALVNPPGPGIDAFAGSYALAERSNTVAIGESDGRAIIEMVGVAPRTENDDLIRTLDHLEFSGRVADLRKSGRIDSATQRQLFDMAHESTGMTEFKSRMQYGGARLVGATEHRYLMTTLETPQGQRPQDWKECEAWVRAFGFDQYENVCNVPQTQQHQFTVSAQR